MSYIDTYFRRVTHYGNNVAEIAQKQGEHSFDIWLKESPHAVDLNSESGVFFRGIILTSKDDPNKKIMFLNVSKKVPLHPGDIVNWTESGVTEKWIIFRKERKVNEAYQVFSMIRCNYYIKWVDVNGHVCGSWCYFVSSMDNKVKENFRTWNSLITPQPNKYAEILIPDPELMINKRTKFVVEDEVWYTIETDNSSVPGIMYLSLCEEKINAIYDDLDIDLADTDKVATYELLLPEEKQTFKVGEEIIPMFTITKNGKTIENNYDFEYMSSNKKIAKVVDGKLMALSAGEVEIEMTAIGRPEINKKINVIINNVVKPAFAAYIDGDGSIRLDRMATYRVVANDEISSVEFSLASDLLAKLIINADGTCSIKANDKNKLGTIELIAKVNGITLTKQIKIIPLW